MELKKNDRVMYKNRTGTVVSDMGYYHITNKSSYIDILFDGEKFICPVRKDCLKKINTYDTKHRFDIANYKGCTYISEPFKHIEINIEEVAKKMKEGLENMNVEFGTKKDEPIQLNTRKDIDNKCYEIMKEKTLYICLEELAELQQAITKFLRGKPNMENIEEEIADVEICLQWVKDIIKPNENHIEAWKDYKYNRMKSRIEKGEMK